jgi:NAD(P)-dependent dehydrogenase (short-subunit alcohol dehydrogenase family)
MSELRYDGRVAVITGAARGLGACYARLLASKGAKVVVNDIGAALNGEGIDAGPAQTLVQEIRAAGGEAVASTDSVATPEGGRAIVQAALDHYGRIDILIPNAGNVRYALMKEISYEDFEAVLDVHLRGTFHVVRPAFARMCDAGYGRIVLTSSISGLYGNLRCGNYAVSKTSMIGLCNILALEGDGFGVKTNVVAPGSITRMAGEWDTSHYPPTMDPKHVAPAVAWLSHEDCWVNGEIFASIAGRVARMYLAETPGVFREAWTVEEIGKQMSAIRDASRPLAFNPFPTGIREHIAYSFEMARAGEKQLG